LDKISAVELVTSIASWMSLRQPELESRCFPGEVVLSRAVATPAKRIEIVSKSFSTAVGQGNVDLSIFARATG
jgi:hypothetical protein